MPVAVAVVGRSEDVIKTLKEASSNDMTALEAALKNTKNIQWRLSGFPALSGYNQH